MSYSIDFRECVVQNIVSGMSWDDAGHVFNISRNTIQRWMRQFRETGNLEPPARKPQKERKTNIEQLLRLVDELPDATLEELANQLNVHYSTIDYHLKKRNITRKKNHAIRGTRRGKKT